MDHCSKEKEISNLTTAIFGLNGEDGLLNDVREIRANIKCLLRFQIQIEEKNKRDNKYEEEIRELEKQNKNIQYWLVRLVITTVLTIFGIIIQMIL